MKHGSFVAHFCLCLLLFQNRISHAQDAQAQPILSLIAVSVFSHWRCSVNSGNLRINRHQKKINFPDLLTDSSKQNCVTH
jgi:hypothetical protein